MDEEMSTPNRKLLQSFLAEADTPQRATLASQAKSLLSVAGLSLLAAASSPFRAARDTIAGAKRVSFPGLATPPMAKRASTEIEQNGDAAMPVEVPTYDWVAASRSVSVHSARTSGFACSIGDRAPLLVGEEVADFGLCSDCTNVILLDDEADDTLDIQDE